MTLLGGGKVLSYFTAEKTTAEKGCDLHEAMAEPGIPV